MTIIFLLTYTLDLGKCFPKPTIFVWMCFRNRRSLWTDRIGENSLEMQILELEESCLKGILNVIYLKKHYFSYIISIRRWDMTTIFLLKFTLEIGTCFTCSEHISWICSGNDRVLKWIFWWETAQNLRFQSFKNSFKKSFWMWYFQKITESSTSTRKRAAKTHPIEIFWVSKTSSYF